MVDIKPYDCGEGDLRIFRTMSGTLRHFGFQKFLMKCFFTLWYFILELSQIEVAQLLLNGYLERPILKRLPRLS